MFDILKNAWNIPDIRKKITFTLVIILLFRIGAAIPRTFSGPTVLRI
jgi:preprotein translocase subunit SecY